MSTQVNVKKGSKDSFGSGTESQAKQDICGMCNESIKQVESFDTCLSYANHKLITSWS